MDEEEFKSFMTKPHRDPELVKNICSSTETNFLALKWKRKDPSLTLKQVDLMAKELRKQISVSISLVESGIAQPEDVI